MMNEAIRLIRIYHDLKQGDMAKKLSISASYLSEIEKGKKTFPFKLLEKYKEIFEISPSIILKFSEFLTLDAKNIKNKIAQNIVNTIEKQLF